MNEFYVYILICSDGSYYTGHTDNMEKRLAKHNAGAFDGYTSTRLQLKLIYLEMFHTRDEASLAERKIKGWSRRKKEILIQKGWEALKK
jgi:predicted GIY-YIG superfamily endonuclease